ERLRRIRSVQRNECRCPALVGHKTLDGIDRDPEVIIRSIIALIMICLDPLAVLLLGRSQLGEWATEGGVLRAWLKLTAQAIAMVVGCLWRKADRAQRAR